MYTFDAPSGRSGGLGGGDPHAPKAGTDKTEKTKGASRLGLIATWGLEFGYVSLHEPTTGEWWDVKVKDAPGWAVGEARRRKAR
jgi:hypothetical protein